MSKHKNRAAWSGVFPATLLPFKDDGTYAIDEVGLRSYVRRFVGVDGISGLVPNGHTGEIQALFPEERARVVQIMADEVGDSLPIISGVSAEASLEAIHHAQMAQKAGAKGILLMPPHQWLRFGRESETAIRFVNDVASNIDIAVIIHQYPSWTKVSYSTDELVELAKITNVVAIKDGTRDMAKYERNIRHLRASEPEVAILTCHDEYLLTTLVQGIDGALVGFAGFVPELISALVQTALADRLTEAREISNSVYVLKQAVYRMGEPSADAHQRMKTAVWLMGQISSPVVRPPMAPLTPDVVDSIRRDLGKVGMLTGATA